MYQRSSCMSAGDTPCQTYLQILKIQATAHGKNAGTRPQAPGTRRWALYCQVSAFVGEQRRQGRDGGQRFPSLDYSSSWSLFTSGLVGISVGKSPIYHPRSPESPIHLPTRLQVKLTFTRGNASDSRRLQLSPLASESFSCTSFLAPPHPHAAAYHLCPSPYPRCGLQ